MLPMQNGQVTSAGDTKLLRFVCVVRIQLRIRTAEDGDVVMVELSRGEGARAIERKTLLAGKLVVNQDLNVKDLEIGTRRILAQELGDEAPVDLMQLEMRGKPSLAARLALKSGTCAKKLTERDDNAEVKGSMSYPQLKTLYHYYDVDVRLEAGVACTWLKVLHRTEAIESTDGPSRMSSYLYDIWTYSSRHWMLEHEKFGRWTTLQWDYNGKVIHTWTWMAGWPRDHYSLDGHLPDGVYEVTSNGGKRYLVSPRCLRHFETRPGAGRVAVARF